MVAKIGIFPIHRLLFKRDFGLMIHYFKNGAFSLEKIDEKDTRGNTAILLAGKLSP